MGIPGETIRTTCPYCGVGCGVLVLPDGKGGAAVKGDPLHPANFGRLCSKGSALGETLGLEGRLLYPEIAGKRVSWAEALNHVAAELRRIRETHGPKAIAFYLSGQLLTEDYYVANKLAKGFIGTPHVDTNSRLCMASSVAGHRRAFGADVVPQCYEDLELADLVVLVGSNAAWCHPILYQRIQKARAERGTRVVNIDPRRTATSEGADLQLSIAPGMDSFLWNGLLVWLADKGALDEAFIAAHTEGFEAALNQARAQAPTPESVAEAAGLTTEEVQTFYRWWTETPRVISCYSQGVNQSAQGTDKVNAIINCHLATGRIGKLGAGPLSFTGQPNAMGGREVGGLANMLAAHMGFSEIERDRVRRFWGAPNLVEGEGLKAVQMFEAIARGEIKALWVMGTNPAVSLPDADRVREALKRLELFIVSENVASNDTANLAHVRLPAAAWGEKDGTVTNSERRISRQRAFLTLPGEARPDWQILSEVAGRLGWGEAFAYSGVDAVFREHAALSGYENEGGRAFDISAFSVVSKADYDAIEPFQWPYRRGQTPQQRLFAEGGFFTASGKARFVAVKPAQLFALPDGTWPFMLNTGRIRDQWHTMTRTGKSARLCAHISEPFIEIHPADAARFSLTDGTIAKVTTRFGMALFRVVISEGQRQGSLFAPIHWSAENSAAARTCALVHPVTDPISGQPEAKATPARIAAVPLSHYGLLLTRKPLACHEIPYWAVAKIEGGHATAFAMNEPQGGWDRWVKPLLAPLAGNGDSWLTFEDKGLGLYRAVCFDGDRLEAILYVGNEPAIPAADWLKLLFARESFTANERRSLLAGRPATGNAGQGRIVCVCFQVGETRIAEAIAQGAHTPEAVGAILRAGTNCGSCLPEIRRMVAAAKALLAAAE